MNARRFALSALASVSVLAIAATVEASPMPRAKPTPQSVVEVIEPAPVAYDDLAVTYTPDPISEPIAVAPEPLPLDPIRYEAFSVPEVLTITPATAVETTSFVSEPVTYAPLETAPVYSAPAPAVIAPAVVPTVDWVQPAVHQPSILHISNDKMKLHELVLRPDITTAINFEGSERITTVLMGRAEDFFVDTPKNRQTISIRPKTSRSRSNLTVVTSKDVHHYNLTAVSENSDQAPVYGVIVENKSDREKKGGVDIDNLTDLNFSYTYRASDALRPLRLFDDGKHTYFQFPQHVATPAIFAVNKDGEESIVNHHVEGHYVVVETLGRQFTLRRGSEFTCIYNKAFPKTKFGGDAPKREGTS